MREKIEKFVTAWERKAKADAHLDAHLHPRIKAPLIEGLLSLFEQELEERAIAKAEDAARARSIYPPRPDSPVDAEQMAAFRAQLRKPKAKTTKGGRKSA